MSYPNTDMGRVTWMSRDDDEKVTYKSGVKRRVFSLLTVSEFSHKDFLSRAYLPYVIYKINFGHFHS